MRNYFFPRPLNDRRWWVTCGSDPCKPSPVVGERRFDSRRLQLRALKLDVKKFSHELRDFRNYIHPYEQLASKFTPDKHTAEICLQVLKAAIADLSGGRK